MMPVAGGAGPMLVVGWVMMVVRQAYSRARLMELASVQRACSRALPAALAGLIDSRRGLNQNCLHRRLCDLVVMIVQGYYFVLPT